MERRLAAIMATDVVGFSRLMGVDEAGTLAALKAHRAELVDAKIAEHQGRIVKLTGDGMLVEFPSVVSAVACAAEIQRTMRERNRGMPEERRIEFRIGLNVGDVIVEGEDIFGDGVNVAARLETVAEPGGIAVSGMARDHIGNRLDLVFEDAGEQWLKNIERPVQVYRVALAPAEQAKATARSLQRPQADKPSVAVLPFSNMSGDPEQEYFADGITEDVITQLSRFRSLLVISRPSTFTYKGQAAGAQAVARQLGVTYVVEGRVRKAGNRVRVSAQLIDAESGSHLWAERYDRHLEEIFSVQDEMVENIVANVADRLDNVGRERALRKPPEHLSLYDLVLKGRYLLNRGSKDDILHARYVFQNALRMDANNARAHVGLAWTYLVEATSDWAETSSASARSAFDCARTAVELDNQDSEAHLILAWAYFRTRSDFDLAASQIGSAIKLNPNDWHNYCFKGWLLTCSGDPDNGILCANEALRRNPLAPNDCLYTTGVAEYLKGRYEKALVAFAQMSSSRHLDICAYMAACYAELGRSDDARCQADEFLQQAKSELTDSPAQNAESWRAYWARRVQFKEPERLEVLLASLRKAGLP